MTLDDDLASKLRATARERGVSFKEVVNGTLRQGLSADSAPSRPYRLPVRGMGLRSDVNVDKALRLAGELEDAEIVRKLEQRK